MRHPRSAPSQAGQRRSVRVNAIAVECQPVPASPPPLARHRERFETLLRLAAPALDLLLEAGDCLSRAVARGDQPEPIPVYAAERGGDRPRRQVGPGAEGSD